MAEAKQTIYIDAEDDITAVIDKLNDAKKSIVALVLPKRADVLKSVVNMKLLKQSAKKAKKQAVIITTDESILRIAASTKTYTASSLKSKPAIPKPAAIKQTTKKSDTDGKEATPKKTTTKVAAKPVAAKNNGPSKTPKKLKVPDFGVFRKRLIIGGLVLVVLPMAWFTMFRLLLSGKIIITTNAR